MLGCSSKNLKPTYAIESLIIRYPDPHSLSTRPSQQLFQKTVYRTEPHTRTSRQRRYLLRNHLLHRSYSYPNRLSLTKCILDLISREIPYPSGFLAHKSQCLS